MAGKPGDSVPEPMRENGRGSTPSRLDRLTIGETSC